MPIDRLVAALLSSGLALPVEITGCSDEEIALIEKDQNIKVPRLYRDFLLRIGRGAGRLLEGSDAFFPAIIGLRKAALDLLAANSECFGLPENALVFLMHQGYLFLCLLTAVGDEDPPVLTYEEGAGVLEQRWPHFSDFLQQALSDHLSTDRHHAEQ
jgi:SMI1-KNR4 cell-wall